MSVSLARNTRITFVGGQSFTPDETKLARNWFNATQDAPMGKGRIPNDVLFAWHSEGRPVHEPAPKNDIVATVFFRRLDIKGRPNGKVREQDVTRSELGQSGRGRPSTVSYLAAANLDRDKTLVTRIVTSQGAVHSVGVDADTGEYVIRWESKSDQRLVILELLRTIAAYRGALEDNGVTVPEVATQDA